MIGRNDNALKRVNRVESEFVSALILLKGDKDCAFNLRCRDASYRSGFGLPPPQQRRTDVEAISNVVLAGKTRAHAIAFIVVELAGEQSATFRSFCLPTIGIGGEELLNPLEGRAIDNGFMLALEPLAAVVNLAEIDAVLQEMGRGDHR